MSHSNVHHLKHTALSFERIGGCVRGQRCGTSERVPSVNVMTLQTVPHATILRCMENAARRYRLMIAELLSRRVPLVYPESANGCYLSITTGSGIHVWTISREVANEAGINPSTLRETGALHQRCIEDKHMPHAPVRVEWQPTHAADVELRPLLDADGRVEHVFVRLAKGRFPHARYQLATYVMVAGSGCFLDANARLIGACVTGWACAE